MPALTRVVIIGAGYAGVMAANRLAGNGSLAGSISVTVINPVADFVERIRLHEVAAGSRESAALPMRSLLHERAVAVQGIASRIDPHSREVHFSDGRQPVNYDVLLYSAGSTQNMVPENAYGLGSSSDAALLHSRLQQLSDGSVVNIVGGGLTGVELAAEIAQKHPQLLTRLVSRGRIAEGLTPAARRAMGRRLHAIGVELVENTAVRQCHQTSIATDGGATLRSDCTIWAAGFRAPDLARNSLLPTDALGRLKVNGFLQCPQYPEIFGAGDAIAAPDAVAGHLRMSCAAALPLGAHAADNMVAALAGQEPAPVSAGYLLKCISLGRGTGLVQPVQSNDQPRRFIIGGRLGGLVKEQICIMTVKWLQKELRNSGSYSWPKGPARQSGAFQ